jgi:hypothetical protein
MKRNERNVLAGVCSFIVNISVIRRNQNVQKVNYVIRKGINGKRKIFVETVKFVKSNRDVRRFN